MSDERWWSRMSPRWWVLLMVVNVAFNWWRFTVTGWWINMLTVALSAFVCGLWFSIWRDEDWR